MSSLAILRPQSMATSLRLLQRSLRGANVVSRPSCKLESNTPVFATQRRTQTTQASTSQSIRHLRGYTKPAYEYRRDAAPLGSQLEWDQVSPKRFERALDRMDQFYNLQESITAHLGVHNWMMSNAIKIKSDSPTLTEDVRQAWVALRYKHPGLSSRIEGDRWIYEVPQNEIEVEKWLNATFFVHDTNKTAREIYPELPTRPLKQAVLHFLPRTQEILLQAPHTHLDGVGLVTFYDNIMQELAEPSPVVFGNEGKNLLPGMTPLAHIQQYSEAQKSRWDRNAQEWLADMPTVRLDTKTSPAVGKSKLQWLRFSKSDTSNILSAVKKHKLTVTSAAQAAVSHAARTHGGDPTKSTCSTIALYDAREYISPKYARSDLVGAFTVATPIKFRMGSFIQTAKNARELIVSEKADKYALTMSPYYTSEFPRLLTAPRPEGAVRPLPSNAHLTSLGNLDRVFKAQYSGSASTVELGDAWCTLDIMTPDVLVTVWSLHGQLNIQCDYNEAFFPGKTIERLLTLVKEQFEEGLEIELNPQMMRPGMEEFAPVKPRSQSYATVHRTAESPWEGEPCRPLEVQYA